MSLDFQALCCCHSLPHPPPPPPVRASKPSEGVCQIQNYLHSQAPSRTARTLWCSTDWLHNYIVIVVTSIGRFSEAGLHEWMPFVIFHVRSHKRSQCHFRADFWVGVASRCVYQWKLNLALWSSTNATTVAVAKITGERGWRVEKMSLHHFLADQKIVISWEKNAFWGIL